jgi:predicted Zn-dependent protease
LTFSPLQPLARRGVALLLAAALAAGQPAAAQVRLPALGESATEDFTAGSERKLGEQIMRDVLRDPDYLDDPVLLEYLQSLWRPLVAVAKQRGDIEPDVESQFAWEAFLVRDKAVNAFALPGGWVGVHLGLIAMTATRDELASVLAHELTHVTQRHIARGVVNSQRQSLVGLAALILGVLAASRSNNADAVNAAIMGGQAVAIQGQLNFSREMEREADRVGYALLVGAGFEPAGMASMFDKLDSANRLNDSGAFPYLRTHPLSVERLAEARSRHLFEARGAHGSSLQHPLMQARSRVLMDSSVQSLRRLQEPLKGAGNAPPNERLAQLYAASLASVLLGDHALAERGLGEAMVKVRGIGDPQAERALQLLQAQALLARGDAAGALAALDAVKLDRDARPLLLLRAQATLDARRQGAPGGAPAALRASTEALQTWVAEHRRDAPAWALLSATSAAAGLRLRSLRADAESRAAQGDLNAAIDRLRAAQSVARASTEPDFIEASIVDARLRELQWQRRQWVLESRGGRAPRDEGTPQ